MTKGTDMSRMPEILDGLIAKTEEGKLTWRTTLGSDSFMTSVDTIAILVREDFDKRHRLSILNDEGLTVQVLQTPITEFRGSETENDATPEQARQLSRLFTLARGSALKADLTLEQLAKSLANIS